MRLWSDSFIEGGVIPPECAFALIDPATHTRFAANRNPHLAWDDVPPGTQSLALFCRDDDTPSVAANVNQEGKVVAEDLPRVEFYHWTLVDIPVALRSISEGMFSELVTPHGKPGPLVPFSIKNGTEHELRQALNDYTSWFAGDPDMAGDYYGYDGPCPPWNDLRPHAYIFCLYALDVARVALEGRFTGAEARLAIRGHILDEAQVFGVYSLNPEVAESLSR
jgi:Raf kinase inhibitor-like YbhB/YbcL family protein